MNPNEKKIKFNDFSFRFFFCDVAKKQSVHCVYIRTTIVKSRATSMSQGWTSLSSRTHDCWKTSAKMNLHDVVLCFLRDNATQSHRPFTPRLSTLTIALNAHD